MQRLGLREAAALAVLLAAIIVALPFALDRPEAGTPREPRVEGIAPPPTATPTPTSLPPTPTPTPQPLAPRALLGWTLRFERDDGGGRYTAAAEATVEAVDITVPGYPFPDVPDDRWRLVAEGLLEIPADGRYRLEAEFDGELRVFVDGNLAAAAEDPRDGPRRLRAEFDRGAGVAEVRIEVRDVGGPLTLRLLVPAAD